MLAFDIETEGLEPLQHRIIVVSVYDPDRCFERTFHFMRGDPDIHECERLDLIKCLDDADSLCSFNGVRFDLPFICKRLGVPDEQQGRWVLKTFDFFEICKLCFGSSCSLKNLLAANGHESKSSTGLQAIEWAKQERWDKVEAYCMRDAILTHRICASSKPVVLPLTGWSHSVECVRKKLKDGQNYPHISFV